MASKRDAAPSGALGEALQQIFKQYRATVCTGASGQISNARRAKARPRRAARDISAGMLERYNKKPNGNEPKPSSTCAEASFVETELFCDQIFEISHLPVRILLIGREDNLFIGAETRAGNLRCISCWQIRLTSRQTHSKDSAFQFGRADLNLASMCPDDLPYNEQAQPQPARQFMRSCSTLMHERLED